MTSWKLVGVATTAIKKADSAGVRAGPALPYTIPPASPAPRAGALFENVLVALDFACRRFGALDSQDVTKLGEKHVFVRALGGGGRGPAGHEDF